MVDNFSLFQLISFQLIHQVSASSSKTRLSEIRSLTSFDKGEEASLTNSSPNRPFHMSTLSEINLHIIFVTISTT